MAKLTIWRWLGTDAAFVVNYAPRGSLTIGIENAKAGRTAWVVKVVEKSDE